MIFFGNSLIILTQTWTELKNIVLSKSIGFQHEERSDSYTIFSIDDKIAYNATIYKGTIPGEDTSGQAQNNADLSEFEIYYKSSSNLPMDSIGRFNDPRTIHRLGNLTTGSVSEVLVSTRPYTEPSSEAQRSIVSTSVQDSNPSGTGAKQIRITFLNSNYTKKIEDITLNGTSSVNTVSTDIRFVERMDVIKGSSAAGAVKLMTGITGSGTEICGIGAASNETFLCHHYIPSGSQAWLLGWGATIDDDCSMKLTGQAYFSGNLVNQIVDLEKMFGISSAPGYLNFYREIKGIYFQPKTYVKVTCAPSQSTNTTVRSYLDLWEIVH